MRGLKFRILMIFLMCILMVTSACTNDGGQAVKEQNKQGLNMQQSTPE
jgi:hypothetical protein